MNKTFIYLVFYSFILILILSSCKKEEEVSPEEIIEETKEECLEVPPLQENIIGVWRSAPGEATIEFKTDGTFEKSRLYVLSIGLDFETQTYTVTDSLLTLFGETILSDTTRVWQKEWFVIDRNDCCELDLLRGTLELRSYLVRKI